jgi:hypothetical protein
MTDPDIDPTALAPHQAVADPALGGLLTPSPQVFDHPQPQDDLDRGRRAAVNQGPRQASAQVGVPRLAQGIVVEHASQSAQDRVQRQAQSRHQGQQVHGRIAITQHAVSSRIEHTAVPHHMRQETGFAPKSSATAAVLWYHAR